ncbi:MAG: hypothetical protein ACKOX3_03280 [Bacteroidota bacterium]
MKKIILSLVFVLSFTLNNDVNAQCSMCRQAAESGIKKGEMQGRGLNKGILFLMAIPYVLGGTAFFIYKKNKRKKTSIEQ